MTKNQDRIVYRRETSSTSIIDEQKLMRMHQRDPFEESRNALPIATVETVELVHDALLGDVLYHQQIETQLCIDIHGRIDTRQEWTLRRMIHRDQYGRLMHTVLPCRPDLDARLETNASTVPLMHVDGLPRNLRSQIKAALGADRSLKSIAPIIEHYAMSNSWRGYAYKDIGAVSFVADQLVHVLAGAKSAADIAANMFGSENVRSDVVKAVAQAHLEDLHYVHLLWDDSMPVDWVVNCLRRIKAERDAILANQQALEQWCEYDYRKRMLAAGLTPPTRRKSSIDGIEQTQNESARLLLSGLDSRSRGKLLRRPLSEKDDKHLIDALRNHMMLTKWIHGDLLLPVETFDHCDSWADFEHKVNIICNRTRALHQEQREQAHQDELDRRGEWLCTPQGLAWAKSRDEAAQRAAAAHAKEHAKRMKLLAEQKAVTSKAYHAFVKKIQDPDWSQHGLSYEVATSNTQLQAWGQTMHNCIAGYSVDVLSSGQVLLAVYDRSRMMIANVQVYISNEDGHLRIGQIEGRRNDRWLQHQREAVIADLNRTGAMLHH